MSAGAPPKLSSALGIPLEAALAVAAAQEPLGGSPDHRGVDLVDLGHVAELHQAVGRQRLVARVAAEPLVALLRRLVAGQLDVTFLQQVLRLARDGRVGHVVLLHVLQRQHVGVVRRRRLLEAPVGLGQNALDPLLQVGQRGRDTR